MRSEPRRNLGILVSSASPKSYRRKLFNVMITFLRLQGFTKILRASSRQSLLTIRIHRKTPLKSSLIFIFASFSRNETRSRIGMNESREIRQRREFNFAEGEIYSSSMRRIRNSSGLSPFKRLIVFEYRVSTGW